MAKLVVLLYSVLITFLDLSIIVNPSSQDQSHEILQESGIDSIGVNIHEYANGNGDIDTESLPVPPGTLVLEPAQLRFEKNPLCLPKVASVTISNRSNSTVRLNAISGNSAHFHSSFFDTKTIAPEGNTTFNVVFLGREKGILESTLYIHTSKGTYKYPVSAVGVESEYRLEHFVGIRIPSNGTFDPIIYMHNPNDYFIQITEASTSDDRLSIDIPSNEYSKNGRYYGDGSMWKIAPHETKPVLRLHANSLLFPSKTFYLRIRVDNKLLIVIIELVVEAPGRPYAYPALVDAGRGGYSDPPTTIGLYARNSGLKSWRVRGGGVRAKSLCARPASYIPSNSQSNSVVLRVLDVVIPPIPNSFTQVAELHINWRNVYTTGECSGSIRILTDCSNDCALLYTYNVRAIPGTLKFDPDALTFVVSDPGGFNERNVTVANMFQTVMHITDIVYDHALLQHFTVREYKPLKLASAEKAIMMSVKPKSKAVEQYYQTAIRIVTDLGNYNLRVLIYSETSEISIQLKDDLDWVPARNERDGLILGPVSSKGIRAKVYILPRAPKVVCLPLGASHSILRPKNLKSMITGEPCSCIDSQSEFDIVIRQTIKGWIQIGAQRIPVDVQIAQNTFEVQPVRIEHCVLGALCKAPLFVENKLSEEVKVEKVVIEGDPNLYYRSEMVSAIPPNFAGSIGTLYYAQIMEPLERDLNSEAGDVDELLKDIALANKRYERYKKSPNTHTIHIQLLIDKRAQSKDCKVEIEIAWPTLVSLSQDPSVIVYSSTAPRIAQKEEQGEDDFEDFFGAKQNIIKSSSNRNNVVYWTPKLSVYNPTRRNIALALIHCAQCKNHIHKDLRAKAVTSSSSSKEKSVVKLPPQMVKEMNRARTALDKPKWFILKPKQTHHFDIPHHNQIIYIRNNLTLVEEISVKVEDDLPIMRVGGQKSFSTTPLLIELLPEDIMQCANTQIVARRSFTARNMGTKPISIKEITINKSPCASYGFSIVVCEPFTLNANASRKIDIVFVPDFTLSKVLRTIEFTTDRGYKLEYLIEATLPASSCPRCLASAPRPKWEKSLQGFVLVVGVASAFLVISLAFIESDRMLKAMNAISRDPADAQPLDLRNISNKWESNSEDESTAKLKSSDYVKPESPKVKRRVIPNRIDPSKLSREFIEKYEREMCEKKLLKDIFGHTLTIIHPPKPKQTQSKSCETDCDLLCDKKSTSTSCSTSTNDSDTKVKRAKKVEEIVETEQSKPEAKTEPIKVDSVTQTPAEAKIKEKHLRCTEQSEPVVPVDPHCLLKIVKHVKPTKKERLVMKPKRTHTKQETSPKPEKMAKSSKHENGKKGAKKEPCEPPAPVAKRNSTPKCEVAPRKESPVIATKAHLDKVEKQPVREISKPKSYKNIPMPPKSSMAFAQLQQNSTSLFSNNNNPEWNMNGSERETNVKKNDLISDNVLVEREYCASESPISFVERISQRQNDFVQYSNKENRTNSPSLLNGNTTPTNNTRPSIESLFGDFATRSTAAFNPHVSSSASTPSDTPRSADFISSSNSKWGVSTPTSSHNATVYPWSYLSDSRWSSDVDPSRMWTQNRSPPPPGFNSLNTVPLVPPPPHQHPPYHPHPAQPLTRVYDPFQTSTIWSPNIGTDKSWGLDKDKK